jgi:polar amino acid transport system permease protein
MNSFLALIPRFADAILVTLEVSVVAAFIGALGGFVLNALRLRFPQLLGAPYRIYIWLVRGTPYLSQLVIVYFGLPVIGVTMTAVQDFPSRLGQHSKWAHGSGARIRH